MRPSILKADVAPAPPSDATVIPSIAEVMDPDLLVCSTAQFAAHEILTGKIKDYQIKQGAPQGYLTAPLTDLPLEWRPKTYNLPPILKYDPRRDQPIRMRPGGLGSTSSFDLRRTGPNPLFGANSGVLSNPGTHVGDNVTDGLPAGVKLDPHNDTAADFYRLLAGDRNMQRLDKDDAWTFKMLKQSTTPAGSLQPLILRVHFRDGETAWHPKVLAIANQWSTELGGRIKFELGDRETAHIRASFKRRGDEPGGNWCKYGNQANAVLDKNRATMMLESWSKEPEDRQKFLVLHEFGHALGLRHEHQHPQAGIKWKKDVVRAYYRARGYSDTDINEQIFNTYTDSAYLCLGATTFDRTSVMMYPIPKEHLESGEATPVNAKLSKGDVACVRAVYEIY